MASFSEKIRTLIDQRLGETGAIREKSTQWIVEELELPVSRETLRKVIHEDHTPRTEIQRKLLAALETSTSSDEQTGRDYYNAGTATRDEIKELVRSQGLTEIPAIESQCDFVLQPTKLGLSKKVLFRCLEDYSTKRQVSDSYFLPVLADIETARRQLGISDDESVLITHRDPSVELIAVAAARGTAIKTYSMFVGERLSLSDIAETFAARLRRRFIDGSMYQRVSAFEVEPGKSKLVPDSFQALTDFLELSTGSCLAAILGSYGTGKSSLALSVAHYLASQQAKDYISWKIPLWVSASDVDIYDLPTSFARAFTRQTEEASLPWSILKRMFADGRIWLFVDGIDETRQFRNKDNIPDLISQLAEIAGPFGRIIIAGRKEAFSEDEEQQFFHDLPRAGGFDDTLILQMRVMDDHIWKKALKNRLRERAQDCIRSIEANTHLLEFVRRPIFMHIVGQAPELIPAPGEHVSLAKLFEKYILQWSELESRKDIIQAFRAEDRMETCELLALLCVQFGAKSSGFSIDEIESLAKNELQEAFHTKDFHEFAKEARVAMFLERGEGNRYTFSHEPLLEFFIARRFKRELLAYRSTPITQIRRPLYLGRIPLSREDALCPIFVYEYLEAAKENPNRLLETKLAEALSWEKMTLTDELVRDATASPPFGVGPYLHLIPNLARLKQQVSNNRDCLDLSGSHLAMTDLGNLRTIGAGRVKLDAANLECARLDDNLLDSDALLRPGAFANRNQLEEYCRVHRLNEPSRFCSLELQPELKEEFVLIPGGVYSVAGHTPQKDENGWIIGEDPHHEGVEVHLPAFLIQRYPVTNGQFYQFLKEFPHFEKSTQQQELPNDWYLDYWPRVGSSYFEQPSWLNRPVVQVSWWAARAFAAASGMRLPTEVEWEIASRVGQEEELSLLPWSADGKLFYGDPEPRPAAIFKSLDEEERTDVPTYSVFDVPAGFKSWIAAKSLDVPFHMMGLIREWVLDSWADYYPCMLDTERRQPVNLGYIKDEMRWTPSSTPYRDQPRVVRGGSYKSDQEHVRCSHRASLRADNLNADQGFRCVRPIWVPRSHL